MLAEPLETQMEATFQKLWRANSKWANKALQDAVEYAKGTNPRLHGSKDNSGQADEITSIFYGSLWPSLKGRGWKEETKDEGKYFIYDGNKVSVSMHLCCGI